MSNASTLVALTGVLERTHTMTAVALRRIHGKLGFTGISELTYSTLRTGTQR